MLIQTFDGRSPSFFRSPVLLFEFRREILGLTGSTARHYRIQRQELLSCMGC